MGPKLRYPTVVVTAFLLAVLGTCHGGEHRLSLRAFAPGTLVLDPLKKYYVFCDLSVREKAVRGKLGL